MIKAIRNCTCIGGDVELLFEYIPKESRDLSFSIYKQAYQILEGTRKRRRYVYLLKRDDDKFPIPLCKSDVEKIIEKPELGVGLCINTWFSRYR